MLPKIENGLLAVPLEARQTKSLACGSASSRRRLVIAFLTVGLEIPLQKENGGEIASVIDPQNLLPRMLSIADDERYPMLSSIDLYGDITLNRLQIPRFLAEWSKISLLARTSDEKVIMTEIENLARRCVEEVHLYLKFIGD